MLVPSTADQGDLEVVYSEPTVHAALVGLAPVYAHGLKIGLAGAGVRCTVLRAVTDLPGLLTSAASLVAVLPDDDGPTLAALRVDGPARLEAVHVLSEGSIQAYSRALRSGATGAFEDSAELEQVIRTVRCAGLGFTLLPAPVAKALSRPQFGPPPDLAPHERHYLRCLADGATVSGLARRSGYSEREMYRLLSAVYGRLGAHNRTEALLLAERWGLLAEETP